MRGLRSAAIIALALAGCSEASGDLEAPRQSPEDLLAGEVMAVAYSGFREGQHPDRGEGAVNPSAEEILEDLEVLVAHDFHLIRMYDSGENTRQTLELIGRHDLPIKVLLGIWLDAELSNHAGCPWLDEPIPNEQLAANAVKNAAEIQSGIELRKGLRHFAVFVKFESLPRHVLGFVIRAKFDIIKRHSVALNLRFKTFKKDSYWRFGDKIRRC